MTLASPRPTSVTPGQRPCSPGTLTPSSEPRPVPVLRNQVKVQGEEERKTVGNFAHRYSSGGAQCGPFVCLDNGSYLRRGLCSGLLSPRIKGSQACSPLVQRHRGGTANLIEEAALGRPFRDAPLSPNAVISPSLCWGGIKITKKVILSIFFLIIIVRLGDKGPT